MTNSKSCVSYKFSNSSFFLGLVTFFMQCGATIVHSTGDLVTQNHIFYSNQLFLLRCSSEVMGNFMKIVSGYLSDISYDRKKYLYLGYVSVFFLKLSFFACLFKFKFVTILFCITHVMDRICNSLRDAPRDALIVDSVNNNQSKNSLNSFAMRKSIGSLGTVVGGCFTFFLLTRCDIPFKALYLIPIFFVSIAVFVLHIFIKNIEVKPKNYKGLNINKTSILLSIIKYSIILTGSLILNNMICDCWCFVKYCFLSLFFILSYLLYSANDNKFSINGVIIGLPISVIFFGFFYFLFSGHNLSFILCPIIASIIPLIIQSPLVQNLRKENNEWIKKFCLICLLTILIYLGKFSESFYFKRALSLNLKATYIPIMFAGMYLFMSIFSISIPYIIKKIRSTVGFLIILISIIAICNSFFVNLFNLSNPFISLLIACVLWGIYNAGIEVIITNAISTIMPKDKNLNGTILSVFFFIVCFFNIMTNTFYYKLFTGYSLHTFGIVSTICPLLSLLVIPFLKIT